MRQFGTLLLLIRTASIHSFASRRMPPGRNKQTSKNLPEKICVVCNRPFTWRKKWERCWDEVTTCSKRCNSERRKAKQKPVETNKEKGQKNCDLCASNVDLLVRCRIDESKQWKMVCGRCWPQVSGGVVDGDSQHPFYQYGGLWKNRHANKQISTKPPPVPKDDAAFAPSSPDFLDASFS